MCERKTHRENKTTLKQIAFIELGWDMLRLRKAFVAPEKNNAQFKYEFVDVLRGYNAQITACLKLNILTCIYSMNNK